MAQFDVCRNTNRRTQRVVPYLLDVQADLLADSRRRIAVPLVRKAELGPTIDRLCPVFVIEGVEVAMSTLELTSLPREVLGEPVASLADRREEILAAVGLLFFGV